MVQVLIIADDLTGANDTGVQFARQGIPTLVTMYRGVDVGALADEIAVLVVDTESRHLPADEAAARVGSVARRAAESSVRIFYKKTDSTLRGNVGAELESLMRAVGSDRLAFIPAYPKTSRTTRGGFQYVGRDMLHASPFGNDPLEPADESFIPAILARQTPIPVSLVPLLRNEPSRAFSRDAKGILVFDCEMDDDLGSIGEILLANDALRVTAGPAGFAEILPELLGLPRSRISVRRHAGPMLVVGGSLSKVSCRQVAFACRHGFADVALSPEVMSWDGACPSPRGHEAAADVARLGRAGRDVVVRAATDPSRVPVGIDQAFARRLAGNLGQIVAHALRKGSFGSCVVFGGDTTLGVIEALAATGLLPQDEIAPGVVVSELVGASVQINFVTKAGGFGDEDVILRIADYLRKD
jgi:D-threonate/D-erythronate kinase